VVDVFVSAAIPSHAAGPESDVDALAAEVVEFWQGREDRLHNRIKMSGEHVERLQP